MWEMTRSILRDWFQSELSCGPVCWRCHDSCIPAGHPCWLCWLKVSKGNGEQQGYSVLSHPAFSTTVVDLIQRQTACEFSFIPLRWCKIKVLTVWKFGQFYPVSCQSWWKWMHSCVTKDGKKHLTTAQWRGFVVVFIVKEWLSIILEALLNLSPPSSAHLESRFLSFIPASGRKAAVVSRQRRKSFQ